MKFFQKLFKGFKRIIKNLYFLINIKSLQISENAQLKSYRGSNFSNENLRFIRKSIGNKKVVIFGLRNQRDTFRYIFSSFYLTLKKLDIPVVWVDNLISSNEIISSGDVVLAVNVAGDCLEIKGDVKYCLHNFDIIKYQSKNVVHLQVYTDQAISPGIEYWNTATLFDPRLRILYQPWGTNLLPWEFLPPTYSRINKVYWIGSVWNNELNQGNIEMISDLKKALSKQNIGFIHKANVSDQRNISYIRKSRIAPAFGGGWQAEKNYLPCRVFKNISYGQLGIVNVGKFKDIFGEAFINGETIEELVENSLSISEKDYLELTNIQQNKIQNHTYLDKIANILVAFEK